MFRRRRPQRFGQDPARGSSRDLDAGERRQRRREIVQRRVFRVLAGPYPAAHEDERDVGVVVVGCSVRGALGLAHPVRLEDDLEVARPLGVEAAQDAAANPIGGDIAEQQLVPRVHARHVRNLDGGRGRDPAHLRGIEPERLHELVVQVRRRSGRRHQPLAFTEFRRERVLNRVEQFLGRHASAGQAPIAQRLGHRGDAVIRREGHERVLKPDGLVDVIQETPDRQVGPPRDVPHLRRIRTVLVTDRVVRGEADGEQIRRIAHAEALAVQELAGKAEDQLVADRAAVDRVVEVRSSFGRELPQRGGRRHQTRP